MSNRVWHAYSAGNGGELLGPRCGANRRFEGDPDYDPTCGDCADILESAPSQPSSDLQHGCWLDSPTKALCGARRRSDEDWSNPSKPYCPTCAITYLEIELISNS